jgi:hypothetical protein
MLMKSIGYLMLFGVLSAASVQSDDSLVRAVAVGDIETVKHLLRGGADANAGRLYQMPPIAFPLMMNNPEIFHALADAGADLRAIPVFNFAAYADSADSGVIERLLSAGVSIHAKGPQGRDALTAAMNSGNRVMARAALRAGLSYEPLIRAAVAKAMPLIQFSSLKFSNATGCVSCHHLSLPVMAVSAAKRAGIPIDENLYAQAREALQRPYRSRREELAAGTARIADADTGLPYGMIAAAAAGQKLDPTIEAMVQYMAKLQQRNGAWGTGARRPPMEGSPFTATALNLHALQLYGGPPDAIAGAKTWLLKSAPQSTEDVVMQIFGLAWAGVDTSRLAGPAANLLASQRPDGGWAETETLETNAYSTAEALAALRAAGSLQISDEAWLRGVDYLLRTQQDDGSWFVRSRSAPVQPFVDSGFPHGRHQFISTAGTCWAVMALVQQMPETSPQRKGK